MGIDVGVDVCTSAKINVINRTFIHILVIPLINPSAERGWQAAEQLSINGVVPSIMSRCHLFIQ